VNEKLVKDKISRIEDPELRRLVEACLEQVPNHFWMKPSSSTGKYHPKDEHLPGGLSLHTARVSDVAELIIDSLKYRCTPDIVRTGALLHDISRYGTAEKPTEHSLHNHPLLGAGWVAEVGHKLDPPIEEDKLQEVCSTVRSHMGRWHDPSPDSVNEVLVHLADVIAAGYIPVRGERLE